MPKGRELLGLPLIDAVTGDRLGEVEDLVINPGEQTVSGFLIDKGNWFRSARKIPRSLVRSVSRESIKVENPEAVALSEQERLVSCLNGKPVKTIQAKLLGTVQDVVVDQECREIAGFEISDGLISDMVNGRVVIDQSSIITQSENAVVVKDVLEKIWSNQSTEGGLWT